VPSRRAAHPAKSSSASRTGRPTERLPANPADRERAATWTRHARVTLWTALRRGVRVCRDE
jgi:hypothetical protein